jgi:beta-galactosidase
MEKPTSEADKFAQRYMFTKCVEMVKAYRSHPSVIEYCLQNEIGADLNNPDTLAILKAMHDEDPSRCVVLNDGFVAPPRKAAQAWYAPWSSERSDTPKASCIAATKSPGADWWNQHQGAGDQWYDAFYKSPTDFTYRSPEHKVISEFGEMEGCARPDNHLLMVHQITETYKKYGGTSYDLADHEEIIAGYNRFLDKWGFRKAFPTAESVFLACGLTEYQSWQNYMENARLSDDLDFAAISGWESTAIENHSGIVDNLRNFKSDPKLIAGSLLPIRPIAKQRALCIELSQPATFDLFLANDTGKPATGELVFTVTTPKGSRTELFRCHAPTQTPDVFSYLLKEAFITPPLTEEGLYRFQFSLTYAPLATQTRELWVTHAYPEDMDCKALRVGVSGISPVLRQQLESLGCAAVSDFKHGEIYGAIITSGLTAHTSATQSAGETTGTEAHPTTAAKQPETLGQIDPAILDAVRAGTPLLCIPQTDALSDGCAQQLAAASAFAFQGNVGGYRAPWMGNWYFGREHALFDGLPTNAALGNFYQIPARQSNGLLIDGKDVKILIAYSRDHDRQVGAGTFTTRLGKGKVLYHRTPDFHPVLQARFLANAIRWLTA